MIRRNLAVLGAIFAGAALVTPALAETSMLVNVQFPRHHPLYLGVILPFKKNAERVTEGRLKVKLSDSGLGPSRTMWKMVTSGVADMSIMFTAYERKRLAIFGFSQLPFATKDASSASMAMWKTYIKFLKKKDPFKGVKLLGMTTLTGTHIYMRNKPFNTVADLKGVKVRTGPGVQAKIMKAVGAVPVVGVGKHFHPYMSKGIVDAMIGNPSTLNTYKIAKYVKYETRIPGKWGNAAFAVMMNQKKFDSLSAKERKAVMRIAGANLSRTGGAAYDKQTKAARESGWKIKSQFASPALLANLKKIVAPFEAGWVRSAAKRGVDGKALLAYYRSQQGLPAK